MKQLSEERLQPQPNEQVKTCQSCGRVLPLNDFPLHRISKDGHMSTCRDCRRRKTKGDTEVNPLAKYTARELMHELRNRGYEGEIKYVEVKVHKMNLKEM